MIYLVIKTGYEGIEELNWLTSNPQEAIQKAMLMKIASVKELVDMAYCFEEEDELVLEEITEKDIQRAKDFICIQKWTGSEFICACSELNMKPSQSMLR